MSAPGLYWILLLIPLEIAMLVWCVRAPGRLARIAFSSHLQGELAGRLAQPSLVGWLAFSVGGVSMSLVMHPAIPEPVWRPWVLYVIGHQLFWLVIMAAPALVKSPSLPKSRITDALAYSLVVLFNTSIMDIGIVAFMPWCDEVHRLLITVYNSTYIVPLILIIPHQVRANRLAIVSTMACLLLALLAAGDPFVFTLGLYLLGFGAMAYVLAGALDRALRDAEQQRRAADLARSEAIAERDIRTRFLAAASHDLGHPLQSARLFFDQSQRGNDEAARAEAATHTRMALGALERRLRQILDHLHFDAANPAVRLEVLMAGQVIAHSVSQFEPLAKLARIELVANTSNLTVLADPDLLDRALGNLIDNAIRHSGARRIAVSARATDGQVEIRVSDDGRGIAADDRTTIFEDFTQGRGARGGFGLGLASVRRAMAVMGGEVRIDPKRRKGTLVILQLPTPA